MAESMTDLERKNLRRAMYSREAARTEEDEEGERTQERVMMTAAGMSMCMTGVGASQPDLMLMFPLMIDAG